MDTNDTLDDAYRAAAARFTSVDWVNTAIVVGAVTACVWQWITGG